MKHETGTRVVEVGDSASVTKTVSESDAYTFAGITGDFHPIHTNEEFAKATQFGRRLVHGALSMGFFAAAASRLAADIGCPTSVPHHYDVRFRRPIFFGDTITATVKVVEKRPETGELVMDANISNQRGEVVTKGSVAMRVGSERLEGQEA